MGRIRVLPDQVANKIAAGEVVERPASVVKELLENSLDAGATSFLLEVESGGRRLIRIADDGCGMLRDDALLAFERHATSKLRDVKDLLSIATLGFRGEALPSIASVSRLLLETRAEEEATGTRVEIAGGKMLRCEEAARGKGTTITVRDLFYNVPARKKFLRTDQTELAHIASLVTHYSLAHPDKTFELRNGPIQLLHVTPVATLRERVFQVFGSGTLEELVDLGVRERELLLPPGPSEPGVEPEPRETKVFRLSGFVSRPQVQKANRNSIFVFVNGRLIRDRLLLHALSAAYHNLMPAGHVPVRAAVSHLRSGRGGRECASVQDGSALPPSIVHARFCSRHIARASDRDAARAGVLCNSIGATRRAPAFFRVFANDGEHGGCRRIRRRNDAFAAAAGSRRVCDRLYRAGICAASPARSRAAARFRCRLDFIGHRSPSIASCACRTRTGRFRARHCRCPPR